MPKLQVKWPSQLRDNVTLSGGPESVKWVFNQVSIRAESVGRRATAWAGTKPFTCPICRFEGHFVTVHPSGGKRKDAICPKCGAAERHRLQYLVMDRLGQTRDFSTMSILHIAPERSMSGSLRSWFGSYTSGDINPDSVDMAVDLTDITLPDHSFDVVYASHVLEHITEDKKALAEIGRILSPEGFAILPVPVVGDRTIEYPKSNPAEHGHVRAPGTDYFDRYGPYFSRIEVFDSEDFDERYQLFTHDDRTKYPTPARPLRLYSEGDRHLDFVPVAWAKQS
jgi:SAM-dependent methyltransferase